jgi:hypothetical protein
MSAGNHLLMLEIPGRVRRAAAKHGVSAASLRLI